MTQEEIDRQKDVYGVSAPLSSEIRALLARCMSQIELEWGQPDAELRAVLGVPLDAPIGTKPGAGEQAARQNEEGDADAT